MSDIGKDFQLAHSARNIAKGGNVGPKSQSRRSIKEILRFLYSDGL